MVCHAHWLVCMTILRLLAGAAHLAVLCPAGSSSTISTTGCKTTIAAVAPATDSISTGLPSTALSVFEAVFFLLMMSLLRLLLPLLVVLVCFNVLH
jgi:hypothetical protein